MPLFSAVHSSAFVKVSIHSNIRYTQHKSEDKNFPPVTSSLWPISFVSSVESTIYYAIYYHMRYGLKFDKIALATYLSCNPRGGVPNASIIFIMYGLLGKSLMDMSYIIRLCHRGRTKTRCVTWLKPVWNYTILSHSFASSWNLHDFPSNFSILLAM